MTVAGAVFPNRTIGIWVRALLTVPCLSGCSVSLVDIHQMANEHTTHFQMSPGRLSHPWLRIIGWEVEVRVKIILDANDKDYT